MDPFTNLREQLSLARRIEERTDEADREDRPFTEKERTEHCEDADRLAELVLALDKWRYTGGFDPYTTKETA